MIKIKNDGQKGASKLRLHLIISPVFVLVNKLGVFFLNLLLLLLFFFGSWHINHAVFRLPHIYVYQQVVIPL